MTTTTHWKPKDRPCSHRRYLLSCQDYDQLLERAEHRCQICRRTAEETGHGILFVDHDDQLGNWAVRGVLCNRCNSNLDSLQGEALEKYLSAPWYGEQGLNVDLGSEPPVGSVIQVASSRVRWRRVSDRWERESGRYASSTWLRLIKRYGPTNIVIAKQAPSDEPYVRRLARENGIKAKPRGKQAAQ